MQYLHRVRKTDLARNTRQVLRAVQRGQTAIIESHGQPEAAILDIVDYYLQRAAIAYYTQAPAIDPDAGLSGEAAASTGDDQARYNLVLAHYLGGALSLARAAELLDLPWIDLRLRFARLDIPIHTSPGAPAELEGDIRNASRLTRRSKDDD